MTGNHKNVHFGSSSKTDTVCCNSENRVYKVEMKTLPAEFFHRSSVGLHFLNSLFGHRHAVNIVGECYLFVTNSKAQFSCINQSLSHRPMIFS